MGIKRVVIFFMVIIALPLFPFIIEATSHEAYVKKVIDGDSLVVILKGKEERIQLIGVDAPDKEHPNKVIKYLN